MPETLDAYRALADRGELTARVEGNLLWTRDKGDEQVAELVDLRSKGTAGRLRIRGAKIFQDGVMENFTAAVLEPYLDGNGGSTGSRGLGMHEPDELAHMVTLLDAEGFQVHIHTIGDRAVRESLDAFEAARRANGVARLSTPPRAHPAHPSGRRPPLPGAGSGRKRTASLGDPLGLRPGSDASLHQRRDGADDVPVRKPPPCGRNDCDGKRLDSLDRESAPTDSSRSEPRRSRGRRLGAVSPGRAARASGPPSPLSRSAPPS